MGTTTGANAPPAAVTAAPRWCALPAAVVTGWLLTPPPPPPASTSAGLSRSQLGTHWFISLVARDRVADIYPHLCRALQQQCSLQPHVPAARHDGTALARRVATAAGPIADRAIERDYGVSVIRSCC